MSIADIWGFVQENGWVWPVAIAVIAKLVDISPIKINPWKWAWAKLGKAINADVLAELEEVKKQNAETKKRLEEHIDVDDRRDANLHRQRILRFNTELIRGMNFTREYFADTLMDIDDYEKYCDEHKGYKNSKAVMAIANIRRVCEEHEQNNTFLKE